MNTRNFAIRLILGSIFSIGLLSFAAGAAEGDVFEGHYDWSNGGKDTLVATFTPNGENEYKVKFVFRWSGKSNTWKGSATGNLSEGPISGSVSAPGGRDWVFRGQIQDGLFTAEHFEIRSGSEVATGTLEARVKE